MFRKVTAATTGFIPEVETTIKAEREREREKSS